MPPIHRIQSPTPPDFLERLIMSGTQSLLIRASFAQASYANIVSTDRQSLIDALQTEAGGFTATQAARFANRYSLVAQFSDDASASGGNGTSFSVSVFKESGTNKFNA